MTPLVVRGERGYYLVVLEHVWTEFGERLDLEADLLTAVRAVHDRQARPDASDQGINASVYGDASPVIITPE